MLAIFTQLRLLPARHALAPGSRMKRRGTWLARRSTSGGEQLLIQLTPPHPSWLQDEEAWHLARQEVNLRR